MNTQDEILQTLSALSLIFDYKLEDNKAKLYVDLLSDINPSALHQAAVRHMQCGRSFPLPVELRQLAAQAE